MARPDGSLTGYGHVGKPAPSLWRSQIVVTFNLCAPQIVTTKAMEIVWDEPKRLANIAKHGIDFADIGEDFFSRR